MKRIIVVEDRPWRTTNATIKLQEKGVEFYKTLYYPGTLISGQEKNNLQEYEKQTKIDVETIKTQDEFVSKMEELYVLDDVIFLMDYDLKGDMNTEDFYSRINIKYAKEKREQGEFKIRFYTTGGADVKEILVEEFEDYIVSVPVLQDENVYWDEKEILKMVEE